MKYLDGYIMLGLQVYESQVPVLICAENVFHDVMMVTFSIPAYYANNCSKHVKLNYAQNVYMQL